MNKAQFGSPWMPYLLLAPQMVVTMLFFFWPAGEAVWQSAFLPDPFGLKSQFVGFENFEYLFTDPYYLASFRTTAAFSALVPKLFCTLTSAPCCSSDSTTCSWPLQAAHISTV